MTRQHEYKSRVIWTGNSGQGTAGYRSYARTWDVAVPGKPVIHCSNDPLLGGDPGLMNPEDLLLSALAACHMLWYLHLASDAGICVLNYEDAPVAVGETAPDGAGRFLSATLRPRITAAAGADLQRAHDLHGEIHRFCFIARSVNFPVHHAPVIEISPRT
ncbi:OsmC family protein [Primorskyibacter aestuariivivens]|uniref:OsmC family protein n=1 Tax=Primorskyibacter aestuariivivens TaxID=1888912 RepID=UPI00230151BD|nr:OsmC family protein [Primorskyibacter aestuariivivens]MDA7428954.1 OsmC family protein [Primorskyibacter aestuariivivens]